MILSENLHVMKYIYTRCQEQDPIMMKLKISTCLAHNKYRGSFIKSMSELEQEDALVLEAFQRSSVSVPGWAQLFPKLQIKNQTKMGMPCWCHLTWVESGCSSQ